MSETRCFFDITINNIDIGRIVFELFTDSCPKTCENFRSLCTGEAGIGKVHEKQLYYKGIIFHRVVKGFMVQSGDFINSNGTGGESIYGKTFDDENLTLKHDKPFLLSMANRGKNTNSSQFFITTAPASHLDGIHTIFGRVVSGQDVVRQIENLPVDRNSRPLDEAMVKACGELVKQVKEKKKKKKEVEESQSSDSDSSSSSSSSSSDDEKKKKKKKKEKKKSKKASKRKDDESSIEEGELESDTEGINPLVSVTKIDPKEIPEVTNKFLMRAEKPRDQDDKDRRSTDRNGSDNRRERNFGWSKRHVPQSRSGRIIKGRGSFRYRTPSRSRSRSFTPEHWKAATRKLIKFSEFEKLEEEKRKRDDEIKRRMEERKKRHEAIARGDGKKSFFELSQEATEVTVARVEIEAPKESDDKEKSINDELDYEADDIVEEIVKKKDENDQKARKFEKSSSIQDRMDKIRKRSRSRDYDRRNDGRQDNNDFRRRRDDDRNRNYDRNNRFDRYRRDDRDRDRNRFQNRERERERDRRRSSSRSHSRHNRRRSPDDRNTSRKKSVSPVKSNKSREHQKVDDSKKIEKSPKMKYNETDIEDLERRVLEAKKVLEIIVKEKEKEEEEAKHNKRSHSRSSKRSDRKKRRRSSSD